MISEFQKKFSGMPVELSMGSVLGLRSYTPYLGVLRGSYAPWLTAEMEAECKDCEVSPNIEDTCPCGIYAYWSNKDLSSTNINAVIEGFGITLIGDDGFRCQKARILALSHPDFSRCGWEKIPTVGEATVHLEEDTYECALTAVRYKVPVFDSVAEMLVEFPVSNKYAN